ncbi:MAG TPA: hypothetical protein VLA89_14060 [Gemmatimonadales bacterium]|nr:hypothetical protein [Gemmatimonadales bacterium]
MPAAYGNKHPKAKMTTAKVRQARKSYEVRDKDGKRKWTLASLAAKYGVTAQTMHAIIHRKSWSHVQ